MEKGQSQKKNVILSKDELRSKIVMKMCDLDLWKDELAAELPAGWETFNNFVIFNTKCFKSDCWLQAGSQLWEYISEIFAGKSIALQGKITNDDFRSPSARIVHGESPWVEYVDNKIFYTWNIKYSMFCRGNVSERHRVARLNCEDKVVVDMFAGIGYFTLPYLVHAGAKKVIACEWNPWSVEALRRNLEINRVADKCEIFEGDVREHCPRKIADHVNLGLIPTSEPYWPAAADILNPSGGIFHVHGNVESLLKVPQQCDRCILMLKSLQPDDCKNDAGFTMYAENVNLINIVQENDTVIHWKKKEWFQWGVHVCHWFSDYLSKTSGSKWKVQPVYLHRVKAYAPHIDHLVLDVCCENCQT